MQEKILFPDRSKSDFVTDVEADSFPKGLNEETIRAISAKKKEPDYVLEFRLKAYKQWLKMKEPSWADIDYNPVDYQGLTYYSAPKERPKLNSLDEVDPEILRTFEKLGIPLEEQKRLANVAVDAVFDSVSIRTTFKEKLRQAGVILCPISEAFRKYPKIVKKYLGSVVPIEDNFFAALNSAVFSDGSFVYIPEGVICPMELSTYFRINTKNLGQFERTLIIAEKGSHVSYLEGCTAPAFDTNQLHAAVVELVAHEDAEIKYSTVQNWYAGDKDGKGGIYNFVTKRGKCLGKRSKISWIQVEVGSAVTWKYPSCILEGDDSKGVFSSIALTNGKMQVDTGSKMIHLGKNTSSTIISKSIVADESVNNYRGKIKISSKAKNARGYSQCDSMLIGSECSANAFPVLDVKNGSSQVEHEACTSKLDEQKLFYLQARGISKEDAVSMVVNGFCMDIISELPLEFATEAQKLLSLKLENSAG